jgi:hypothetical protein
VRWIGLIAIVLALPAVLSFNYFAWLQAAGQIAAGLILMQRAPWVVDFCYPEKRPSDSWREDDPQR